MIELRTGVPRHGKTLHMVDKLAGLLKRWESHPEEARPVFCHKVYDLKLAHAEMPTVTWLANPRDKETAVEVPDWEAMPDGSIVLIDECDKIFPPRSSAAAAPHHVNWLTEHGHKGFDIWLTTQHPKFIDSKVRALTGKHQHFRRLFGGARSMIYEWDACSDNLSGMKQSVKTLWPYPKNSYQYYKSANIHTKQSFKLPMWLLIPFVGLALGIFAIPRAYSVISNGITGKPLVEKVEPLPVPVVPNSPVEMLPVQPLAGGTPAKVETVNFNEPFKEKQEVLKDRAISELKLSPGIYSDNPADQQHYTEAERLIQQRSVQVLAHLEEQKKHIRSAFIAERDANIPVTFSAPTNGANIF